MKYVLVNAFFRKKNEMKIGHSIFKITNRDSAKLEKSGDQELTKTKDVTMRSNNKKHREIALWARQMNKKSDLERFVTLTGISTTQTTTARGALY